MRRMLLKSIEKLDVDSLTPSDYCLQGYYMEFEDYKAEAMEAEIRTYFNEEFDGLGDKIEYINPAYYIGSYYELSEQLRVLSKELQIVDDYIERNNYTVAKYADMMEMSQHDEDFPKKSNGYCGTKPIDYQETNDAIAETKQRMEKYKKQASE